MSTNERAVLHMNGSTPTRAHAIVPEEGSHLRLMDFCITLHMDGSTAIIAHTTVPGFAACGLGCRKEDGKVDVRLPGKGNSNSHGARPVHLIITMIKWIRTSRLSIKNSLFRTWFAAWGLGCRV